MHNFLLRTQNHSEPITAPIFLQDERSVLQVLNGAILELTGPINDWEFSRLIQVLRGHRLNRGVLSLIPSSTFDILNFFSK